jgi:hypothetical protein
MGGEKLGGALLAASGGVRDAFRSRKRLPSSPMEAATVSANIPPL